MSDWEGKMLKGGGGDSGEESDCAQRFTKLSPSRGRI